MRNLGWAPCLLLLANFVTNIGNGIYTLGIGMILYSKTGSGAAFAGVIVFEYVLAAVFNCVSGPWADRFDPKKILIFVDAIRGVLVCVGAAMLWLGQPMWWIVVITLAIQAGRPLYRAALFSLEPASVPKDRLTLFNGYSNACFQAGQFFGILLAGILISNYGAVMPVALNGITFVISALIISFVRVLPGTSAQIAKSAEGSWRQLRLFLDDWRSAVEMLRGNQGLVWLLVIGAGDYIIASLLNLAMVPLVQLHFAGNAYWLSAIDGSFALGALLVGTQVHRLRQYLGSGSCVVFGLTAQAVSYFLLAAVPSGLIIPILAFCVGAGNAISWTVLVTAVQLQTNPTYRGRIALVRQLSAASFAVIIIPSVGACFVSSVYLALNVSGLVSGCFVLLAFGLYRRRSLPND
jgi:MFS family permease